MLDRIRQIICEFIEVNPMEINPESALKDWDLNSYDIMNIIASCEQEFGIEIPDRDIHQLETIGDIIVYIEQKKV